MKKTLPTPRLRRKKCFNKAATREKKCMKGCRRREWRISRKKSRIKNRNNRWFFAARLAVRVNLFPYGFLPHCKNLRACQDLCRLGFLACAGNPAAFVISLTCSSVSQSRLSVKIAQVAPLYERVPPKFYGGTERIVSYLTEELVRQGHQVTLFASGDSLTSAELVASTGAALRLTPAVRDVIPYYLLMLDKVRERADEFDVLHFHIDQFHFPIFRPIAHRTLTTLHGRQDLPDLQALYRGFPEMPLVSISNAQREPMTTTVN